MKSIIFRDLMPCSPLEVHRCFGTPYCVHLHCRRKRQASNQEEAGGKFICSSYHLLLVCFFLSYSSALKIETLWYSETLVDIYLCTRRYIP
jgi:hypothetical protein